MSEIAESVLDLIGNTPLLRLNRVVQAGWATVLAKLEARNPSGSVKDRLALAIVEDAEARGLLRPGDTIVEASGGNTGIALAMIGAAKGYQVVITVPEAVSPERRRLLTRYGARVHITPSSEGMAGSMRAAAELVRSNPRYYLLGQFRNPASVKVHRERTAQEILDATKGRVDAFVTGVGTGGTVSGVGEALKARAPGVRIIAVEPARSPLLSKGRANEHHIPGLGPDFVPPILNRQVIDEVMAVTDEDAYLMTNRLGREEGLLVGPSSGAAVHATLKVAEGLGEGKTVVVVLPDTGERYLQMPY